MFLYSFLIKILSRYTWRDCGVRCGKSRNFHQRQTLATWNRSELWCRQQDTRFVVDQNCWFNQTSLLVLLLITHFLLWSVGNKNDDPNRKQVQTIDAKRFADSMGIHLFETSAKQNINVEPMFDCITRMLLRSKMQQKMREQAGHEGIRLDKKSGKRRKTKCCWNTFHCPSSIRILSQFISTFLAFISNCLIMFWIVFWYQFLFSQCKCQYYFIAIFITNIFCIIKSWTMFVQLPQSEWLA